MLHTMLRSWRKSGSVSLPDVTPADLVEDFGVDPDPEQTKLGDGFLLLDPQKKLAQQTQEMVAVLDRANLTDVQRQVFVQHMVEGKPLSTIRVTGFETCTIGCLELALQTAIDILLAIIDADKTKKIMSKQIN